MAKLSDRLVKEFVRMTNDTTKKKSESFLYGTVDNINEDGTIDVIFDGADRSTPCASSVSVTEGDRVLVMLKNRQATVTSNVSNPTVNAAYLEAGEAKISGTIHAATYEDSTGNFTMDIGTEQDPQGQVTPAFRIGGYINGDPSNEYLEIEISLYHVEGYDLPHFYLAGAVKDSPDAEDSRRVSLQFDDTAIHFYGSYPGLTTPIHSSIQWGRHI